MDSQIVSSKVAKLKGIPTQEELNNQLKEQVCFSEAAAIIATIWHYVGVGVRGFAIPTK